MFKETSGAMININGKDFELVCNSPSVEDFLKSVKNEESDIFYLRNSVFNNVSTLISYDNAVKLRDYLDEMIKFAEEELSKPEEVDFLTAVQAYNKGKTVYCLYDFNGTNPNNKYRYTKESGWSQEMKDVHGVAVSTNEILKGKWFIEK